ncbi:MAG: hypothetical protein JWM97_2531 [Phycisphaerales bacterium]|nr:hypothetical protein [Phycisphaerales bacterium]
MAKAKKEPTDTANPAAPKKAPAKKAVKAPAKSAAPSGVPLIDTSLAASTAAKLVARKDEVAAASNAPQQGESAAFRHMKENLHRPAGQNTPSFLQNPAQNKKFNSLPTGRKEVGRNQTFGADVNRSGVPRRTGG